jgi:ACS family D-galactonate transporter-like MFS transporter
MARAPEARRGTANIALSGGLALGPLVGTLAGGAILELYGWRPMFIIFGAVTLLWLLPWLAMRREVDAPLGSDDGVAVPYAQLLRSRGLWAISAYHFTGTYALYFIIAWLPLYLVKVRGYDITDMALLTSLFYLGQTAGAAGSAALGDRLIAGGRPASAVRRATGVIASVVATIGVLAIARTETTAALMVWLLLTSVCFGAVTGILFVVGQTLAGPASAGRWVGIQSGVGNLAGIIGPVITGAIVDSAGYGPTFVLTAVVTLAGGAIFAFGVPRIAPIDWRARAR